MVIAVPDRDMQLFLAGRLPAVTTVRWDWRSEPVTAASIATRLLISDYSPVPPSPELVADLPHLRAVQLPSSGVEGWAAVLPGEVVLCNGAGVHGQSTAEAALSGVLALLRGLARSVRQQADRTWQPVPTAQLSGRRVVVLGAGDVARRIATVTVALGCPTALIGSRPRPGVHGIDELETLLTGAQILVIALPLTDRTRHLLDARLLSLLPDGAIVANVARGAIVDTDALTAEVRSGRLSAYLDVTDPEPLPADHPLWAADNVLLTPHTGGADIGWRVRYQELVAAQVARFAAGSALQNVVAH